MNKKKINFLASELTKKESDKKFAKYHILPIPLEKTVSYGKGTRKGPKAILKASNELERNSNEYEPCKKGIYTYPPINCNLPISINLVRSSTVTSRFDFIKMFIHSMLKGTF